MTPFVGLIVEADGKVQVRRTSAVGRVETLGAPPADDPAWSYLLLSHLTDCLRVLDADFLEVDRMAGGGTRLRTITGDFQTELKVHTVPFAMAGFKQHAQKDPFIEMDLAWLAGLSMKPFTLTSPPIISGPTLRLACGASTVTWEGPTDYKLPSSPRESWLRAATSGDTATKLYLCEGGYYVAETPSARFVTAAHRFNIAAQPHTPKLLVQLPKKRLASALRSASSIAADSSSVLIHPMHGVTTKDTYSNIARFGLGAVDPFPPVSFQPRTAKLIGDVLDLIEAATVDVLELTPSLLRFEAKPWAIHVQTVGAGF